MTFKTYLLLLFQISFFNSILAQAFDFTEREQEVFDSVRLELMVKFDLETIDVHPELMDSMLVAFKPVLPEAKFKLLEKEFLAVRDSLRANPDWERQLDYEEDGESSEAEPENESETAPPNPELLEQERKKWEAEAAKREVENELRAAAQNQKTEQYIAWWRSEIKPKLADLHRKYYPMLSAEARVLVDSIGFFHRNFCTSTIKHSRKTYPANPARFKFYELRFGFLAENPNVNFSIFPSEGSHTTVHDGGIFKKWREKIWKDLEPKTRDALETELKKIEQTCHEMNLKLEAGQPNPFPEYSETRKNRLVSFLIFQP